MDLVVTGVVAGVLGTLVMDFLNHLFSRTGVLLKIDMRMIGRMSMGWAHGRFRYRSPSEMEQVANEMLYGYITHYTIGVGLAVPYVLGWDLLVGGTASPIWALADGSNKNKAIRHLKVFRCAVIITTDHSLHSKVFPLPIDITSRYL